MRYEESIVVVGQFRNRTEKILCHQVHEGNEGPFVSWVSLVCPRVLCGKDFGCRRMRHVKAIMGDGFSFL